MLELLTALYILLNWRVVLAGVGLMFIVALFVTDWNLFDGPSQRSMRAELEANASFTVRASAEDPPINSFLTLTVVNPTPYWVRVQDLDCEFQSGPFRFEGTSVMPDGKGIYEYGQRLPYDVAPFSTSEARMIATREFDQQAATSISMERCELTYRPYHRDPTGGKTEMERRNPKWVQSQSF